MNIQSILAASAAAIALVSAPALAQSTGEADASGCRAAPSTPTSAKERARAREARRAEGMQVARSATPGDDQPCALGKAGGANKQDRKAAADRRRADAATALKQDQIKSGEK